MEALNSQGPSMTPDTCLLYTSQKAPASPAATESATLGGKAVTITYSSPGVKGRAGHIFTKDGLISHNPHYPVWRAGANEATKLHTCLLYTSRCV